MSVWLAGLGVSNPEMLLQERQCLSVTPRMRPVKEVLFQIPAGVEKIINRLQIRIGSPCAIDREDGILRAADDEERTRRNQGGNLPHLTPFHYARNAVAYTVLYGIDGVGKCAVVSGDDGEPDPRLKRRPEQSDRAAARQSRHPDARRVDGFQRPQVVDETRGVPASQTDGRHAGEKTVHCQPLTTSPRLPRTL